MNKETKKEIYNAGENDTYTEDVLIKSAQLFIDENLDKIPDDKIDEAIEIYRDGFMGRNQIK